MVLARLQPPAAAIVAALAVLACLPVAGCGGDDDERSASREGRAGPTIVREAPTGEPRIPLLGFSSLPSERTTDSYINAFATAAQYADIVLVQRAPPWEEF